MGTAARANGVLRLLKALRHESPGSAETAKRLGVKANARPTGIEFVLRIALDQLPRHENKDRRRRDHGERDDEARSEPVVLLTRVEHDLQRAEERRDEEKADIVEADASLP